jgi:hypothetical protein
VTVGERAETDGLPPFVEAIEGHLRARRGTEHILSPRDFGIARGWFQAGIPLAAVLVGMDRAFEQDASVSSLAYCRRFVEDLAAAGPLPPPRPAPAAESVPLPEVAEVLGALRERLTAFGPPRSASFGPPLRRVQEIEDLLAVASRPNWSYVRAKLREIDDEVSRAALDALSTEERAELAEEATRAVERHRGRVDEAALRDALQRFSLQRARERLQLPRVSLI